MKLWRLAVRSKRLKVNNDCKLLEHSITVNITECAVT